MRPAGPGPTCDPPSRPRKRWRRTHRGATVGPTANTTRITRVVVYHQTPSWRLALIPESSRIAGAATGSWSRRHECAATRRVEHRWLRRWWRRRRHAATSTTVAMPSRGTPKRERRTETAETSQQSTDKSSTSRRKRAQLLTAFRLQRPNRNTPPPRHPRTDRRHFSRSSTEAASSPLTVDAASRNVRRQRAFQSTPMMRSSTPIELRPRRPAESTPRCRPCAVARP
jgi:hypothetical protein